MTPISQPAKEALPAEPVIPQRPFDHETSVSTASAIIVALHDPFLVLVADSAKHAFPVIPGGKLEEKDCVDGKPSPEQCLRREVFEEIETDILNPRLIGCAVDPERDVRFVSPSKLRGALLSDPIPEELPTTAVVKARYGNPDYIFVGRVDSSAVHETEELKNPRFIDIRTLEPGKLGAGHDVIVLAYRDMLQKGASVLSEGALSDFEAERRQFSHHLLPKPPISPEQEELVRAVLNGARSVSKTLHGVSDTSCSELKPKLSEGEGLQDRSMQNLDRVVRSTLASGPIRVETVDDVRGLVAHIALGLNEGLGGDPSQLLRTWDLAGYGGISHADLPEEMERFYAAFLERWNESAASVVDTSAWIEHEFNGRIHGLADGCIRTSIVLSALSLARDQLHYPMFASRDEYDRAIQMPLAEWTQLYASKIRNR